MTSHAAPSLPATGKTSKTRLPILDGLRGVAALIVIAYHIFDSDAVNSVNHGYLAVDFFFMLSGYVMGYAYDDRWSTMSPGSFFKRRLIRLHPMVIVGSILGAIFFYFGACGLFPLVDRTSFGMLLLSTLLGALLIPSVKSMDVRGVGEAYPLNGPAWSLFYEYVANIAYALFLRRFSRRVLGVLSFVFAGLLTYVIVTSKIGTIGFGWMFTGEHVWKGMVRVLFPFITGLFLFRLGRTIHVKHAMILTSLALLIALPMPRIGPDAMPWVNGLYECFVIILLMPVIVLIGAGSQPVTRSGEKACDFLGELSYPLYLAHYPIHYVFYAWLNNTQPTPGMKTLAGIGVYLSSIAAGYLVMRFVDMPIRKQLARFAR
ncbi:acyltransferase [Luteolibacter ambystomatis]|uniref:Acyltransferase n=1 Tax=Luteolibacter ambystomatis TaxID=2824561 RepID=A0A975PFL1_9BACT|nr:acyltransferase [Luteolibacter ambystomatis]QUE52089.1 acyltransferase [Luteolibacter ambystomatis]